MLGLVLHQAEKAGFAHTRGDRRSGVLHLVGEGTVLIQLRGDVRDRCFHDLGGALLKLGDAGAHLVISCQARGILVTRLEPSQRIGFRLRIPLRQFLSEALVARIPEYRHLLPPMSGYLVELAPCWGGRNGPVGVIGEP